MKAFQLSGWKHLNRSALLTFINQTYCSCSVPCLKYSRICSPQKCELYKTWFLWPLTSNQEEQKYEVSVPTFSTDMFVSVHAAYSQKTFINLAEWCDNVGKLTLLTIYMQSWWGIGYFPASIWQMGMCKWAKLKLNQNNMSTIFYHWVVNICIGNIHRNSSELISERHSVPGIIKQHSYRDIYFWF